MSVNGFNEYFDYRSGLDERTNKTPFSGGSGVAGSTRFLLPGSLMFSGMAFGITLMAGAVFVWEALAIYYPSGAPVYWDCFCRRRVHPLADEESVFLPDSARPGVGILMVGGVSVISGQHPMPRGLAHSSLFCRIICCC